MKPSEFGGSDTDKTLGIQPAPHVLTPSEQLRVMYAGSADDVLAPIPQPVSIGDLIGE